MTSRHNDAWLIKLTIILITLFHHILPNSLAPIIVQGTLATGTAILDAAALGFLGLGAQPPNPEWGKMLSDSKIEKGNEFWILIRPG